jgi:hypothetical protein
MSLIAPLNVNKPKSPDTLIGFIFVHSTETIDFSFLKRIKWL